MSYATGWRCKNGLIGSEAVSPADVAFTSFRSSQRERADAGDADMAFRHVDCVGKHAPLARFGGTPPNLNCYSEALSELTKHKIYLELVYCGDQLFAGPLRVAVIASTKPCVACSPCLKARYSWGSKRAKD